MPRVSKTWSYEASKQGGRYVVNINKQKIVLTPLVGVPRTSENDRRADELYQQAKAIANVRAEGDRNPIYVSLSAWLQWIEKRPQKPVSPSTFLQYQQVVTSFTELHGNLLGREVRAHHLEDWLAVMKQERQHPTNKTSNRWNEGTINLAIRVMRTAFKWCCQRNLISGNPFADPDAEGLKTISIDYEGKRLAIEKWEFDALLRRAVTRSNKDWAVLLMLLYHTGARPSEWICARAEEWDGDRKLVIEAKDPANACRYKLKRYRKNRVIYIPRFLVPFVRLLAEKYKDAPKFPANYHHIAECRDRNKPEPKPLPEVTFLFRLDHDRSDLRYGEERCGRLPLTLPRVGANLRNNRLIINKEAGTELIRPGIAAYSFRRAYVTRWVSRQGRANLKVLATLLGTSVAMIEKHYSHLFRKHDVLLSHLDSFEADGQEEGHPGEASSSGDDLDGLE